MDDALVALDVPVPELVKPAKSEATGLGEVLEQILNFKHLAMEEEEQLITGTLSELGIALEMLNCLAQQPDMAAALEDTYMKGKTSDRKRDRETFLD